MKSAAKHTLKLIVLKKAFHAGPRVFLGQNLATLEALIAIIFLVKCYNFTITPGQDVTYGVSLTLPMRHV